MSHQSDLIATDIEAYLAQHERKDMLRFLTCGSVDDGKSTLIGRLLYDSKMIYEDQLEAIKKDSQRYGTTDSDFDPALLTDGLRAEREQGITIDVAYRYFSTAKRKFIIADTPGHEQYTRNMATGASSCDLAIILIDARYGVLTQTRRHSFIASLLGIKHIIVAINKMDLVDYSQDVFDQIVDEYSAFAARLELGDIRFLPLSALQGDNVVSQSANMAWYQGATLMHLLENVHIASDLNLIDFRLPVQYVNRPDGNFRGYCGTIASGIVRPGDAVMVLPSQKTSRVKEILTFDGPLAEATSPLAVTLTLEDEVDISRGDILVHPNNRPLESHSFEAMLVWMNEDAMRPGKQYLIKHATLKTPGVIRAVRYRMDMNTLHRESTAQLELNEIGRCVFELEKPIAFDPYRKNRATGAFIIIDRLSNNTVGAGMVIDRVPDKTLQERVSVQVEGQQSSDIRPEAGLVSDADRESALGQHALTLWLTGLSGSGKSSIAQALEKRLHNAGFHTYLLDGDNVRFGLNRDLAFSKQDRQENIRRVAEVARLFNQAGLIVLAPVISPFQDDRQKAQEIIGPERFFEIYVDAPLEVCEGRDVKGLYQKARAGEIREFTGISSPYEPPDNPSLRIQTADRSVEDCMEEIFEAIAGRIKSTPS